MDGKRNRHAYMDLESQLGITSGHVLWKFIQIHCQDFVATFQATDEQMPGWLVEHPGYVTRIKGACPNVRRGILAAVLDAAVF